MRRLLECGRFWMEFRYSDPVAIRAIKAILEAGLKVPTMSWSEPAMSTLRLVGVPLATIKSIRAKWGTGRRVTDGRIF
jgi:hypothetical protein